ncbi:MAG TPA: vitamin K epoxide reductase family protein [Terriglobales bacterium]|nr:vitamin K epoxide reductase family protein [Terriglobales bacterium]
MRWILVVLAVAGIVVSSLALREHYRVEASPCSINEKWDCGIVNKSPFAMIYGVPVAVIGMGGYLFLGLLAWRKAFAWMLPFVTGAFAFAIHLADVEALALGVWCIYCVISLGIITLITLCVIGTVIAQSMRRPTYS